MGFQDDLLGMLGGFLCYKHEGDERTGDKERSLIQRHCEDRERLGGALGRQTDVGRRRRGRTRRHGLELSLAACLPVRVRCGELQ